MSDIKTAEGYYDRSLSVRKHDGWCGASGGWWGLILSTHRMHFLTNKQLQPRHSHRLTQLVEL